MSRICGVVAGVNSQERVEHRLAVMLKMLQHNLSFQPGTYVHENVALAHAPTTCYPSSFLVSSAYHNAATVFCGYITGWQHAAQAILEDTHGAVRLDSPADLVAYLYVERGADALVRLNGIFAFALWRPDEGELALGVDRYGMRPLFYLCQGQSVWFASEVKAIRSGVGELTPDYAAFEELLAFGFLFGDRTTFKEIKRVPPATVLQFKGGRMQSNRYWWFDRVEINPNLTIDDYVEGNCYAFRQSIARLTENREKYISLLSAGYDSRRILLELTRAGRQVNAYTFAWGGPGKYTEIDTRPICTIPAVS